MDHMVFKRAQAPELTDLTVDHDFGFGTIPPEIWLTTYEDGIGYEIDLKGITTAAKMADWMFHVHVKSWSNRGVVADFVFALYEISRRGPYWWGEAKALPPGWLQEQAWKNGFPEN